MYTYLALLCAALLSPHTGEQILISALINQVRADAAHVDLPVSDGIEERRALVAALNQMIAGGVISETGGTATAWGERREEALLTVHRALLPQLLARRLADVDTLDAAVATPGDGEPRKSLRRKLVENPLVRREDMTDAERDVLRRERRAVEQVLEEHFGLHLEVRAEGALAYDPDSLTGASDVVFPGRGTVSWATLLLLTELAFRLDPEAGSVVPLPDEQQVPGIFASAELLDEVLGELTAKYGKAWGTQWVEHPRRLRDEVLSFAEQLSLIRLLRSDGEEQELTGVVVHPVVGRYRADASTSASTRAQRRRADQVADDNSVQGGLFDDTDTVGASK